MPPILREFAQYLCNSPRSRWRQLDALRQLDDRMLRDIGLTRYDAMSTASRRTAAFSVRSVDQNHGLMVAAWRIGR